MEAFYKDNHNTIYCLDFRRNDLPDECVQCVVTSPPYWGLRKYSGEQELIWGDNNCEHQWISTPTQEAYSGKRRFIHGHNGEGARAITRKDNPEAWEQLKQGDFCSLCGAWKGAYGLEPTPEMYIEHTIEILREIRRVLRKDGVVFWNIGDAYFGGGFGISPGGTEDFAQRYPKQASNLGTAEHEDRKLLGSLKKRHPVLKPKDLCLIPFRVAIAAQEDGWWVRSVIIWSKPNPMPESVTDRPTESHEYILMLTKSAKYYWDADAVREPYLMNRWGGKYKTNEDVKVSPGEERAGGQGSLNRMNDDCYPHSGRNIRSVWEFPTQPYPEAHFAVFPEKLPELCIKAATPEVGCCSKCGAPWGRIIEKGLTAHDGTTHGKSDPNDKSNKGAYGRLAQLRQAARERGGEYVNTQKTIGWQPTCKCKSPRVPSTVLDPLAGAGTTLWEAKKLNRYAVGYEISGEYCHLGADRCRQQVLL